MQAGARALIRAAKEAVPRNSSNFLAALFSTCTSTARALPCSGSIGRNSSSSVVFATKNAPESFQARLLVPTPVRATARFSSLPKACFSTSTTTTTSTSTESAASAAGADENPQALRVAVILSGSGFMDGSEITEAISTLIHLTANGCVVSCFAPNADFPAVNHLTGQPYLKADGKTPETRNALEEAARIARGKVEPLEKFDPASFDALFLPGGFGAAKNLSTFATDGPDMKVNPTVESVIRAFHEARKPIGAVCIAPVILGKVLKSKATVTLGGEEEAGGEWPFAGATQAVQAMGAKHVPTTLEDVCIDRSARLVTGAAYMCGTAVPHQVFDNVGKVVDGLIALAQEEVR